MTHPTDAAIAQAFREYDEGDIVQMRTILARAREMDAKPEQVHTCSYYCDRPECLKAQRDELRDRLSTPPAQSAESVQVASNPGAILSNEAVEKGRWFCDGPNGYFYSDDADAAREAMSIIDPDGDDWTMTDTLNPFGRAAIGAMEGGR